MNFWSGMFTFTPLESEIDKLLKQDDKSLLQILKCDEFTSEMKTNDNLADYLCEDDNLKQIIKFATLQFPEDMEIAERQTVQLSCISIFTDDCFEVKEKVAKTTSLCNQIISQLSNDDHQKVGMTCLIIKNLLKIKGSMMLPLLKDRDNIVSTLCNHLHRSEVFDLIYELMSMQNNENPKIIQWFCDSGFVKSIVEKMFEYQNDEDSISLYENIIYFIKQIHF